MAAVVARGGAYFKVVGGVNLLVLSDGEQELAAIEMPPKTRIGHIELALEFKDCIRADIKFEDATKYSFEASSMSIMTAWLHSLFVYRHALNLARGRHASLTF